MHVEELADLRHDAEQRIVAARSLALRVVADRRALGVALRGVYRAVEVHRDARELLRGETFHHEVARHPSQVLRSALVGRGQRPRDRRDVGQLRHADQAAG